jgi:hypothetical protein
MLVCVMVVQLTQPDKCREAGTRAPRELSSICLEHS